MVSTPGIIPASTPNARFELWSVPAFDADQPEYLSGSAIGSNKQVVEPDDVLLCKINPRINRVWCVGAAAEWPQIASTEWIVLRSSHVDSRFLMYRLRESSLRENLKANVSGVGGSLTRVRPKEVAEISIALPPLREQRRIADRIDSLRSTALRSCAVLEDAPELLDKFRQSVLASAFRGDLTADWRTRNPNVEPASELLARMRAKHDAAKQGYGGKAGAPTEGVHLLHLEDFPETWAIAELQELCEPGRSITYGILKPGPELSSGIPYVRVADFPKRTINLDTVRNTSLEIASAYRRSTIRTGDILLSIRGSVGRICRVPPELDGGNITQDTVRVSVDPSLNPDYVELALHAPSAQKRMQAAVKGVAVRGINVGDVRVLQLPVAPAAEQEEISRRLSIALAWMDSVARKLSDSDRLMGILEQSILTKAFCGELVPQDPNDEPASVLLERTRAQREAGGSTKGRRRTRAAG
jgi:type I restriction enzyme S subunit